MCKEKFKSVLNKDEKIKWSNKVNVKAATLKSIPIALFAGIFLSIFITPFISIFTSMSGPERLLNYGPSIIFKPALLMFPLIVIIVVIYNYLNAKNTYFCITNKRVIKLSGAFNRKFIHYSLKNLGTIEVIGSIVDFNDSATLVIITKDFHNDSRGSNRNTALKISSLEKAYDAYNILNDLIEGNNENLRIKIEK